MKIKIPFLIIFIFSLMITNVLAEKNEIKITSDKLQINTDANTSTFTGKVYARDKNLKLWSNKMTVNLKKDQSEIKEILASGDVKIIRLGEGTEIFGDTAEYFPKKETIIISGNVIVIEEGNKITGNKLTLDLTNSSSIITGSESKRVEAVIIKN